MACSQVEGILCRLPNVAPPPPHGVAQEGGAIIASTARRENDAKTARAHRQLAWVERRRQVPVAHFPDFPPPVLHPDDNYLVLCLKTDI